MQKEKKFSPCPSPLRPLLRPRNPRIRPRSQTQTTPSSTGVTFITLKTEEEKSNCIKFRSPFNLKMSKRLSKMFFEFF